MVTMLIYEFKHDNFNYIDLLCGQESYLLWAGASNGDIFGGVY